MCKTCNGTGSIPIDYGWGYGFYPCPDSHCNYDVEEAKRKLGEKCEQKLKEYGVLIGA